MDGAGAVGGGEEDAVGGVGEGGDPVGVLGDAIEEGAVGEAVDLEGAGGPAEGGAVELGVDVGGEDGVELFADDGEGEAVGEGPEAEAAQFGFEAPGGEEEAAVAGEVEGVDEVAVGGEGADEFGVVGGEGVEEDLLLARDGDEG